MMFRLLLAASLLVANVFAQTSATHTYNANGKTFSYTLTIFQPPIPIQPDSSRLNQDTAVNCTILFMYRLSKGDIAGAAAITNDPDATVRTYADAKVRMGADEFARQEASLFNGDRYRYELAEGSEHILISEKIPGSAQAVIEKDGKFWMDRPKFQHESQEWNDLFVLVNDHAAGKVEFK